MKNDRDLNKLSKKFVYEKSANSKSAANPAQWSNQTLRNYSATSWNAKITTHFDDIEKLFIHLINTHDIVVGAVAWLTNTAILSALANPERVAIVVQKEDFLRQDVGFSSYTQQQSAIRRLYDNLKPFDPTYFRETYPGQQEIHPQYNHTVQTWLLDNRGNYRFDADPIRCLGFAPTAKERHNPRMHHKFLVFGHKAEGLALWPSCVVTGSFNLSQNAVKSRENVVLVEDDAICQSYISEWAQLWAMSEPLDWSNEIPSTNDFYVGT